MSNFLMMLAGLFTNTCHEANQGFKDSWGAGSSVSQPCKNENVLQSSHGSSAQLYQAKAKVDVKQRVEGLDKSLQGHRNDSQNPCRRNSHLDALPDS